MTRLRDALLGLPSSVDPREAKKRAHRLDHMKRGDFADDLADSVAYTLARRRAARDGVIWAYVDGLNGDWQHHADQVLDALEALPADTDAEEVKSWRLVDPSKVQPRAIEWLWEHRIAIGTLSILAGPGGVGKGALWVDITAQGTRGELAGNRYGTPVNVLILTAEEAISDVISPRLRAAGTDLSRVRIMTMTSDGYDRDATLPDDLPALRAAIEETGARLVIVDPLNAHLSDNIDSHKDAPLRRALGPLTRLAGDTGSAVVGVAHVNKGQGDAVSRVLGSVGYVNAARSVLIVGQPPDTDDGPDRIVAMPKANNSVPVPSLRFTLEGRHIDGILPDGTPGTFEVVGITWRGEDSATANDLLGSTEDRSALGEAIEWLETELRDGPVPKKEISKTSSDQDITRMTLHRAKKHLRVVVERDESKRGRPSTWRLPNDYIPRGYAPNPLGHNQQPSDQGKQADIQDYVPDSDVGTKPPKPTSGPPLDPGCWKCGAETIAASRFGTAGPGWCSDCGPQPEVE